MKNFKISKIIFLTAVILATCTGELKTQDNGYNLYTVQSDLYQKLIDHPDEWFSSGKAEMTAENIMLYQRASGGWPKNVEMTGVISVARRKELSADRKRPRSTFDNGASYTQMLFLAKMIELNPQEKYKKSFLKGLRFIIDAQYDNGGWPQYYPVRKGYYEHITFNDDAMVGVMNILRYIQRNSGTFPFINTDMKDSVDNAIDEGIKCFLNTQITVNGTLKAWCAQHDHITLKPAPARAYELVSLSGKESVGILEFLMGIPEPDTKVIRAIVAGVNWLEKVKIEGIRQEHIPAADSPGGVDKIIVNDPDADPLWARFYEIADDTPFFSDRDGKKYEKMSDISWERRNEYGWYGNWPKELLNIEYPRWRSGIEIDRKQN